MTQKPMSDMGQVSEDDVQIFIHPVWGRCLVEPDAIEETDPVLKRAKEAGIVLAESKSKLEQYTQTEGTLVAVGGNCFETWGDPRPQPGQKVLFDKYAGCTKEVNGRTFRLINDTDVLAIVEKVASSNAVEK